MLQFSERFKTLLLLAIMLTSGGVSAAQEQKTRWYDVEVILFAQKSQSYRESEVWPIDYTLPDIANARELIKLPAEKINPEKPLAFRELNSDELKLNEDAERIDKASDLELLTHFGWRQPGLADDQAVAVRVTVPAADNATATGKPVSQSGIGGTMMIPAEPPRLEGTLKLILSRYLHIDTDLLYREPLQPGESVQQVLMGGSTSTAEAVNGQTATSLQQPDLFMLADRADENQPRYRVYRMLQSRRMRSGELHYLDHPVFGLAVMVTPYEPPVKEAAATATTASQ